MADSPKVPLLNKPGVSNWVEKHNALPKGSWIRRAAEHLQGKGMAEGRAIAVAVNAARRMCSTGDTQFKGMQQVNAASRAEACAAVAKWDAARAKAKATNDLAAVQAFRAIDLASKPRMSKGGQVLNLADAVPADLIDLAKPKRPSMVDRVVAELRKNPRFKNVSDAKLRAAAQRRLGRQALGVQNVNQATGSQQKALRSAGLLPGGKAQTGTVVQHTLTKGPRKGKTITVKLGKGGNWHEVKAKPGQKAVTV
jgi:hypothetical protein